ncbi:hypothetical protein BVG16_20190 [Paenibacillus selenitireducens]|uniref:Flagellar biosynthesis protein FlaG n=2 Tax=Paenibacillus selenitireducens TaxID=1324314 RepID=A0A1T2X7G6_9BACL|nr:hypothetical protein BVG16_20190 [Paenibacillus selenitireducens]
MASIHKQPVGERVPIIDVSNDSQLTKANDLSTMSISELLHKKRYELSISDSAFQEIITKANKALQGIETKLEVSVHKKTGDIMVKVLNKETDEVVREIPPEKFIDLVVKLQELSAGIIIDEKR